MPYQVMSSMTLMTDNGVAVPPY